jgi:DNA-binding protein
MEEKVIKNEIVLFENQDVKLEVNMKDETVWLSQQQMALLFNSSRTNIIEHINNIYSEE